MTNSLPLSVTRCLAVALLSALFPLRGLGLAQGGITPASWQKVATPPAAAAVNALAVDPLNSDIVLAGTTTGVWRSQDAGQSWQPVTDALGIRQLDIRDIAFTGRVAGEVVALSSLYKPRLRSTDGGLTWVATQQDPFAANPASVSDFITADAGGRLYANFLSPAPNGGIATSVDGGSTWQPLAPGQGVFKNPVGHPSASGRVLATVVSGPGYIGRSSNGGVTWATASLTCPTLPGQTGCRVNDIAWATSAPDTAYALLDLESNVAVLGYAVAKTTDGGASWTVGAAQPTPGLTQFSQLKIWVNPTNASQVVISTLDRRVLLSNDGGTTWGDPAAGRAALPLGNQHDVLGLMANGALRHLLVTGDFGVGRTDQQAPSPQWSSSSAGFEGAWSCIDVAASGRYLIGGSTGVYVSSGGGWSQLAPDAVDCRFLPGSDTAALFTSSSGALMRWQNGTVTNVAPGHRVWSFTSASVGGVPGVYAAYSQQGIWRTPDVTAVTPAWQCVSDCAGGASLYWWVSVTSDPGDPNYMVVARRFINTLSGAEASAITSTTAAWSATPPWTSVAYFDEASPQPFVLSNYVSIERIGGNRVVRCIGVVAPGSSNDPADAFCRYVEDSTFASNLGTEVTHPTDQNTLYRVDRGGVRVFRQPRGRRSPTDAFGALANTKHLQFFGGTLHALTDGRGIWRVVPTVGPAPTITFSQLTPVSGGRSELFVGISPPTASIGIATSLDPNLVPTASIAYPTLEAYRQGCCGVDSVTMIPVAATGTARIQLVLQGDLISSTVVVPVTLGGGGGGAVPVSVADTYTVVSGSTLTVAAPGVLANDTSTGGAMTALLVSGVAHGTLTLATTGAFTYVPAAGYTGVDGFTYRASNTAGPGNVVSVTIQVTATSGPQPPTGFRVASVVGDLVTLRWTAPAGTTPTGYVLTGGVAPGQALASVPTGSLQPLYVFTAPSGSFYLRVHAVNGGTLSPASNEVILHVGGQVAPSAPTGLLGLASGASLGLSWTHTFQGGAPVSNILEISGGASASVPIGGGEAFTFDGVPPGTYTFAVRAVNASGVSAPSSPATLTFPGTCPGLPQPPTNFVAQNAAGVLRLAWDPPAAGTAPSSYLLQVGGTYSGALPMTGRTLNVPAPPGTFILSVASVNACGTSTATPAQTVVFP